MDKIADFIQWVTHHYWTPDIGSLEGRIERFNSSVRREVQNNWQDHQNDIAREAEILTQAIKELRESYIERIFSSYLSNELQQPILKLIAIQWFRETRCITAMG